MSARYTCDGCGSDMAPEATRGVVTVLEGHLIIATADDLCSDCMNRAIRFVSGTLRKDGKTGVEPRWPRDTDPGGDLAMKGRIIGAFLEGVFRELGGRVAAYGEEWWYGRREARNAGPPRCPTCGRPVTCPEHGALHVVEGKLS